MGSESELVAWSSYGGRWRVVRVTYPQVIPPGWGRSPWSAVGRGLVWLVPAALITYLMWSLIERAAERLGDVGSGASVGVAVALAVAALPLAALAYGVTMLRSGLSDVGQRVDVEGRVLRRREITVSDKSGGKHTVAVYLAVDDGRSPEIRALRCSPEMAANVRPGVDVRATISPRLAHVYTVDLSARAIRPASPPG